MKRHLVVFAKTPRAGHVKTRLCPPLSAEESAIFAEALLRDVLAVGEELEGRELTLAYTPRGTRGHMAAIASRRWRLRLQVGGDLGERLTRVFGELLSGPPAEVLVVGSDSPQLAPERFDEASAALGRHDVVLGPAEDGGYYLIGLRRWRPGLLDGVRWGTEHALEDTMQRAKDLGLSVALLERDYDVDDMDGLGRLACDLVRLPAERLRHTRRAMAGMADKNVRRHGGREAD